MELWDAYLADGTPTGQTLIRGKEIPRGRYHLVCEVLVKHADGSYLCMRRAATKSVFPGWYEASAGGSALSGEDVLSCIKRELYEETGIGCEAFTEIGVSVSEEEQTLFHSFVCSVDCEKDAIVLQDGETEDYIWMNEEEFRAYLVSGHAIPTQKARYLAYFRQIELLQPSDSTDSGGI